jgi:O-antigen ligase
MLASAAWLSSPYLRDRVIDLVEDLQGHRASDAMTSAGLRLEFWEKSFGFIAAAPLVGHGTGTIAALFRRSASGEAGTTAPVTGNPHNQILAMAINSAWSERFSSSRCGSPTWPCFADPHCCTGTD